MKKLLFSFLFFVLVVSSCSLVKQGKEFRNLFNCKYSLSGIKLISVDGIAVEKLGGSDVPTDMYFSLIQKIFAKNVASSFEFKISVNNPTENPASSQGMDWKLLIKDNEFAGGTVDTAIFVEPQSSSSFKVKADINLFKLINSLSIQELMEMLDNKDWTNIWEKSNLSIKLKPWYKAGDKVKKYPGYITFKP